MKPLTKHYIYFYNMECNLKLFCLVKVHRYPKRKIIHLFKKHPKRIYFLNESHQHNSIITNVIKRYFKAKFTDTNTN